MEEAITEAKRALVREDNVANRDNYRGSPEERLTERLVHATVAQAHATVAVAVGLDRLLGHLEDRAVTVRHDGPVWTRSGDRE